MTRKSRFLLIFLLFFGAVYGESVSDSLVQDTGKLVIKSIRIVGNKKTQSRIIMYYFKINVGDTVTQEDIHNARERLIREGIFRNVVVLPKKNGDEAHVLIIVEEGLSLRFAALGHRFTRKHGREEVWYSGELRTRFINFRGRKEQLEGIIELFDRKKFQLTWKQPYFAKLSPYYLWADAKAFFWPHEYENYNGRTISSELGVGRHLIHNLHLYIRGSYSIIRTDTASQIENFYYPRAGTGLLFENRDNQFRPMKGHYISTGVDQFGFTPDNEVYFLQGSFYWKGYFSLPGYSHYLAVTTRGIKRFGNPRYIHRIYGGGYGSIRGYGQGELKGDNEAVAAAEYRIPVYQSPVIKVPYFNLGYIMPGLDNLFGIVEAGIFWDSGVYWDYGERLAKKKVKNGGGAGLKVWVPVLQASAALDAAINLEGQFNWYAYWDVEF